MHRYVDSHADGNTWKESVSALTDWSGIQWRGDGILQVQRLITWSQLALAPWKSIPCPPLSKYTVTNRKKPLKYVNLTDHQLPTTWKQRMASDNFRGLQKGFLHLAGPASLMYSPAYFKSPLVYDFLSFVNYLTLSTLKHGTWDNPSICSWTMTTQNGSRINSLLFP